MELTNYRINDITVVRAGTARIDYEVAATFKTQLIRALQIDPDTALLMDFSDVHYIDSSGLGALIAAFRESGGKRKMAIAGADAQVSNILRIGRISKIIPVLRAVSDIGKLTSADW